MHYQTFNFIIKGEIQTITINSGSITLIFLRKLFTRLLIKNDRMTDKYESMSLLLIKKIKHFNLVNQNAMNGGQEGVLLRRVCMNRQVHSLIRCDQLVTANWYHILVYVLRVLRFGSSAFGRSRTFPITCTLRLRTSING